MQLCVYGYGRVVAKAVTDTGIKTGALYKSPNTGGFVQGFLGAGWRLDADRV